MTGDDAVLTGRLASRLESSANADGGWPYAQEASSRLEPTCWALLAQLEAGTAPIGGPVVQRGLARLAGWQQAGGLLVDTPGAPANLASNGLAAVVLQRLLAADPARASATVGLVRRLLDGVLAVRGETGRPNAVLRQRNDLVGWPWNDGTSSWVEPTAWCLLALKVARQAGRRAAAARIADAERLLADRCCASGGWNYGNSNVLGRDLRPFVSTTVIALVALRSRREWPEVTRSLAWLAGHWTHEASTMAFSLALVAMRLNGAAAKDVESTLRDRCGTTEALRNTASTAMALYALTGPRHGYAALAV